MGMQFAVPLQSDYILLNTFTCGLAQQTPMQPMIEPAKRRMTAIALVITMAMIQLSTTAMSPQSDTVKGKSRG